MRSPHPTPTPVTPSGHVTSHSTIEKVHVTWMKRLVCFNLVSERYIHSYIMNPETTNIHAVNSQLLVSYSKQALYIFGSSPPGL